MWYNKEKGCKMGISKKLLEKQYTKNKKTIKQIAEENNKSYGSIHYWLIKYQISIRTKSEALKGRKRPDVAKYNQTRNSKGKNNSNYKHGKCCYKYYCNYHKCHNRISISSAIYGKHKCQTHALKGRKHTEKHNIKIGKSLKGLFVKEKNWNWKGGITSLAIGIRNLIEYKSWRKQVFKRDNYTCQECGKIECYIESHHQKFFAEILSEFLKIYSKFQPIEDKETLLRLAVEYKPFWDTTNGQTLCKDCHNLTKGAKNATI